jgi:hypothetical protein
MSQQPPDEALILDYVPQIDTITCQSAVIAKMIGYDDVAEVRAGLEEMGNPGSPAVMGAYLRERVQQYRYLPTASLNDLIFELAAGFKAITHGWFSDSGHVISIVGWDFKAQSFIVDDPWFEFDFIGWTYAPHSDSGDDVHYSAKGIWATCVNGRDCRDAELAYHGRSKLGQHEFAEKGMWLHLIKN